MKVLISMFILMSVSLFAQDDCSELITKTTDKVSGKTYVSNKDMIVLSDDGNYGLGINIMQGGNSIILTIIATEKGVSRCIDEKSKVIFLFKDGSRATILTNGGFNCDSKATIYFFGPFGNKNYYEELSTKDLDIIRVYKSSGYVEKSLSADEAKQFRNTIKCIKKW